MDPRKQPIARRVVVTLKDDVATDTDEVVEELARRGFACVERLELLNCLLGEFEGDARELLNVAEVVAVEEEQAMSPQDPAQDASDRQGS